MPGTEQPKTFIARDVWLRAVLASNLPHVTKCIAVRIGLHLNVEKGRCNPGIGKIATGSHVSERTVYRQVTSLERAGWIAIKRASGLVNQYVLLTPDAILSGVTPDSADNEPLTELVLTPDTWSQSKSGKARGTAKEPASRRQAATTQAERERLLSAAHGSLGDDMAGADAPHAAAEEPKEAKTPVREEAPALNGEIFPPLHDEKSAFEALLALWDRGHVSDRTAAEQKRLRAAWLLVCTVAEPTTIVAGARPWVATADAPRFLPKLPDWLDARGWEKSPPPKKRAGARAPRKRNNSNSTTNSGDDATAAALRRIGRE